MNQRFVRQPVEAISENTGLEVPTGERKARGNLRHGPMKCIVNAGKMGGRRKSRLRRREKSERLGNVQRREMHGGMQILENLRRNFSMGAKVWPAVHDAMTHRYRCGVNMRTDCLSQGGQRFALRLYNTLALEDDVAVRGANVQSAIFVPNAFCA